MHIPSSLRLRVIQRAGDRCEYCGLSQTGQEATFHIDHVIPLAADGPTTFENLALACVSCSLRKGAKLMGLDPETNTAAHLFNPRIHEWREHFEWQSTVLAAKTPTGRATMETLKLNRSMILAIRAEETIRGRHPPSV